MNVLTEFEKPRGIHTVEVRPGYAVVEVLNLAAPLDGKRLDILATVAKAGISVDFLKLTQTGLSFVMPQDKAELAEKTLKSFGAQYEVTGSRSIVMVHAVNMRDEQGLIALVVSTAIRTGIELEHLSDMHDRVLIVCPADEADRLAVELGQIHGGLA
ncbi:MAG: hypothetical protein KF784_13735 [Fimbriimonadaceae bacterium]|nr:hypothetical protein [Fimbriimonadaceae bacterium]